MHSSVGIYLDFLSHSASVFSIKWSFAAIKVILSHFVISTELVCSTVNATNVYLFSNSVMIVVQQSKMAAFSGVDYALFGTFLCISISIGLYHSKKRRGGKESSGDDSGETTEYLMGGRNMPIVPICLSLLTTFMSGISLLGAPGEVYQRGIPYSAVVTWAIS